MNDRILPDWPAPPNVRAVQTTRLGGVSEAPWASLNLGDHVGDDPARVDANRHALRRWLPSEPRWLRQVHGTTALDAALIETAAEADATFARQPGVVCAVMTADCLPILLCDVDGSVVAAAHAGWRGLLAGIVESTVAGMRTSGDRLMAWLGPAIGPASFEVGAEVRSAFMAVSPQSAEAFIPHQDGKWLADIYLLARQRLAALGVTSIHGGNLCTVQDKTRFFSYRRDGVTGRMASIIWLSDSSSGV